MTGRAEGLPSLRSLWRERELWILLGIVILLFSRPLFLGGTLFFRDLSLWFFPQRHRLVELLSAGEPPLWDAFIHGGQPLLANVNNVALYPTAALSLILPPVFAFNLEIVLHFALGAVAAYALARTLGISRVASLLAGVVFTVSGFALSSGSFLNRALAAPWLALLLLFWHLFLRERRRLWFVAASVAGALQILAGSPELLLLSLALAAGWSIAYPYAEPAWPRPRRFGASLLLAAAVLGLSAVQIAPTAELIVGSARGQARSFASFAGWSLSPRRLPELAVPGFLGATDTLNPADFWGSRIEDEHFPLFPSIYFGAAALILAACGGASRDPGPLPRSFRLFLALAAIAALLLSLGRFLPLLPLAYRVAPQLGLFRYPVKFLAAAVLPVALLAAQGADAAFGPDRLPGRLLRAVSASLVVLFAATALGLARSAAFADRFQRFFFESAPDDRVRDGLAGRFGVAAAFTLALALIAAHRLRRPSGAHLPAVAGLLALDLFAAGWRVNPVAPAALLAEIPPAAQTALSHVGSGRLFRDANPPGVVLRAPSNDAAWQCRWNRETLFAYSAAGFDVPVIFHDDFDELAQLRMAELTRVLRLLPWERRLPILSAGAVSIIVTPQELALPGLVPLGLIPNASNAAFSMYRNTGAASRAEFVSQWARVGSPRDAVRAMVSRGFDPRRQVVLEGPGPAAPVVPCAGVVTWLERRAAFQRLSVEAPCDGYLVFAEPHAPGWRARVDGLPAPIRIANAAFSAVFLPAGRHEVARTYRSLPLEVGAGVSVLTLLALTTLRRRR